MKDKAGPRARAGRTIGSLPARVRSCVLYGMALGGEVLFPGWAMQVDKAALIAAIGAARGAGRRRKDVVLLVCEQGLAVRSAEAAAEVPAQGFWASPIAVNGAALRRAVAALRVEQVHLEFGDGRLRLDARSVAAREV